MFGELWLDFDALSKPAIIWACIPTFLYLQKYQTICVLYKVFVEHKLYYKLI